MIATLFLNNRIYKVMQMDKQREAWYISIPEKAPLRLIRYGGLADCLEFHDLRFVNIGMNQYHAVASPEIAEKAFKGRTYDGRL